MRASLSSCPGYQNDGIITSMGQISLNILVDYWDLHILITILPILLLLNLTTQVSGYTYP